MSKFRTRCRNCPTSAEMAVGKEVVDFFRPNFDEDSALYEEVNSLNGISISESKHELANVMRMRLQEVASDGMQLPDLDDNAMLDAMLTKNDEIEDLYHYAREREREFKNN